MAGKLTKCNYKKSSIHAYDVVDYWRCEDCKTEYPEMWHFNRFTEREELDIRCNNSTIKECPYCGESGIGK